MKYYLLLTVLSVYPLGSFLEQLDRAEILVTSFGYPLETHQTETEDNYILTIFRIPHGRNHSISNKSPVLLNHGMLGSAANYIWLGPQRSLAFILADKGYDVWLMNSRGTSYSRKHKSLSPNQREFWNFSFHEIGVYDLPAAIDYILNTTNQSSLYYVGHSQGCTSVFVMGSERPEYNNKIKMAIALAPGAIYKNFNQPLILSLLSRYPLNQLEDLGKSLQLYQFPPPYFSENDIVELATMFCIENKFLRNTCTLFFESLFDTKLERIDKDVKLLAKILPNVAYYSTVPLPDFTHIDFILSKSTKSFVYKPILELLERFK
ncbi:lipase 3-like isoform X3 [Diabrotica undecimpunctata]|uniref:lipase 3-like isoform X3 n=1 Tax=Diabrotica undecimpunctata TaxID=50387 RepID=UPI003B63AC8C